MSCETTYKILTQRLNQARLKAKDLAQKGLINSKEIIECRKTLNVIEDFIIDTFGSCNNNGLEDNKNRLIKLEKELAEVKTERGL